MLHGLGKDFLYTAYRLQPIFADDIGNSRSVSGTGFFVMNKRGELCLVTNKHVLDPTFPRYPASWPPNLTLHSIRVTGKANAAGMPDVEIDHVITGDFRCSVENDVAVGVNVKFVSGTGPLVIDYFIPYSLIADKHEYATSISACDLVAFPGYPEWHDSLSRRPIFRSGTIASDPRYDYSFGGQAKGSCVAYEAFSFGGSSGSPVFAFQKGFPLGPGLSISGYKTARLIGVNAGHFHTSEEKAKGQHSGISYFYKSTAILELIDR